MDSDAYTCGTCRHGNLYDNCAQCERGAAAELMREYEPGGHTMDTESTITTEELARYRDEDAFWRELYIVCLTKGWPPEEAAEWANKALQPAQNRDRI